MDEKQFWLLIRRALLIVCVAIEKRFICKPQATKPEVTNVSTDFLNKS